MKIEIAHRARVLPFLVLLSVALGAGCGGKEGLTGNDTTSDTISDPSIDTASDSAGDSTADTAGDPPEDPATDTVPDAEPDTAADTATDLAAEEPAGTAGVVGDACETADDCLGVPGYPTCLTVVPGGPSGFYTYTNGYCSGDCITSDDCGEGALCAASSSGASMCYRTCTDNSDCRVDEGYVCRARFSDPQTYCMPPRPPHDDPPDATSDVPPDVLPDDTSDVLSDDSPETPSDVPTE